MISCNYMLCIYYAEHLTYRKNMKHLEYMRNYDSRE
jgi:hypothetical protein